MPKAGGRLTYEIHFKTHMPPPATKTVTSTQRQQAIELLGYAPIIESRKTLTDLLDVRQPAAVQIAAVRALADYADADSQQVAFRLAGRQLRRMFARAVTSALLGRAERTRQFLEAALAGHILACPSRHNTTVVLDRASRFCRPIAC